MSWPHRVARVRPLSRVRASARARLLSERKMARLGTVWPELAGFLEWCDARKIWRWGGPMNGQAVRRSIVREIVRAAPPSVAVETGTYRGDTTGFLADVTGAVVHSCEADPRHFEYARRRYDGRTDVRIVLDDSRSFLERLGRDDDVPASAALFYLDAHWGGDLPLADELRLIDRYWTSSVVVVDDFEVPGDPGYGFDDYGPGRKLSAAGLPADLMANRVALYPSAASSEETGARRGCVVLLDESLADRLESTGVLRRPVT